jgi:hypothetical protein
MAALVVAGVASQAFAQHVKEATLNFSLTHQYQYLVTVNGSPSDTDLSWTALVDGDCLDTLKYTSKSKKITQKEIIKAIGFTLGGSFTTKATLVLDNYDNILRAPPYPRYPWWMPGQEDEEGSTYPVWTHPEERVEWPDENYIRWSWIMWLDDTFEYEANVWVKDPSNANSDWRCVNVTPFFEIEENYCFFCWDTMDRVTDGSIQELGSSPVPCFENNTDCGLKGSGKTKWYWTIRFNNTQNNPFFYNDTWLYYWQDWLGFNVNPPALAAYGAAASYSMIWTIGGVVTYSWAYKALGSGEPIDVIGSLSGNVLGYGATPFCGVITGSVSMPEKIILATDCCACTSIYLD